MQLISWIPRITSNKSWSNVTQVFLVIADKSLVSSCQFYQLSDGALEQRTFKVLFFLRTFFSMTLVSWRPRSWLWLLNGRREKSLLSHVHLRGIFFYQIERGYDRKKLENRDLIPQVHGNVWTLPLCSFKIEELWVSKAQESKIKNKRRQWG